MTNLPALGRFKPGTVVGTSATVGKIGLTTSLAGEAIRFSLNESLSSIVSTGTLVMLNADISELGEIQQGVAGDPITEEDEAQWGTFPADRTAVEPNQRVWVTETRGEETCTTYWRVVSFNAYSDENGVPYCDVELESEAAFVAEMKLDTKAAGSAYNFVIYITNIGAGGFPGYWDSLKYWDSYYASLADDYNPTISEGSGELELTSSDLVGCRVIITEPNTYLDRAIDLMRTKWAEFTEPAFELTYLPCYKIYHTGDCIWDIITEILAMNKQVARFKRDRTMIVWSVDSTDPPLGESSVGVLGTGLSASYTKEGVVTNGTVNGWVGKITDGYWEPAGTEKKSKSVQLQAALNITNGEIVEEAYEIPVDYLLDAGTADTVLENWGKNELYKTVLAARGASVSSEGLPLATEVGMLVNGTSKTMGGIKFFVSTLSRNTDIQQQKISTSISGSIYALSLSEGETTAVTGDSWS